jgi:hypothetical protein
MTEHDDVICQVRESFSGLRMDTRVEDVLARSRARRRRRRSGMAAAAAVTAAVAVAVTLTLGEPAPASSGNQAAASTGPARPGPVTLAAYSVTSGPGHSTTLILRRGSWFDPDALRQDLARHGIPALVTVGTFCRSTPGGPAGLGQVLRPSTRPDGSDVMVINGPAMPPGTKLSIGYFSRQVRMTLIKDGAPLSCVNASGQPAAQATPSGEAAQEAERPVTPQPATAVATTPVTAEERARFNRDGYLVIRGAPAR